MPFTKLDMIKFENSTFIPTYFPPVATLYVAAVTLPELKFETKTAGGAGSEISSSMNSTIPVERTSP